MRLTSKVGCPGRAAPLKWLREAGEAGVGGVSRRVQDAGVGQHHGDEADVPAGAAAGCLGAAESGLGSRAGGRGAMVI